MPTVFKTLEKSVWARSGTGYFLQRRKANAFISQRQKNNEMGAKFSSFYFQIHFFDMIHTMNRNEFANRGAITFEIM